MARDRAPNVPGAPTSATRTSATRDFVLDHSETRPATDTAEVRIGELAQHLGLPVWTLRRMADSGRIPSVRSDGGHRLFDPSQVRAALGTDGGGRFGPSPLEPRQQPTWSASYPRAGLEEHRVWLQIVDSTHLDSDTPAAHILEYSMLEMINNAIDHSNGATVAVRVWTSADVLAFQVEDDGEGAFAHLRRGLALVDDFEAISALAKGRQTTWRERHTGEGVFFTSKVSDVYQMQANGKRWTVDNLRDDQAVGTSPVARGTVVYGQIDAQTTRTTTEVFRQYVDQDLAFSRTRPSVRLSSLGLRFASRSEARRLLDGLDDFTDIDLDFGGVPSVGQGFVDEVFRVWPRQNPGKTVNPINMNDAVDFMVRRGLRG